MENDYRRYGRARPLRSLPVATSSKLEKCRNDLHRFLQNRLLGETLCRGQSPEPDTKCGLERSDGGRAEPFNATPLGGSGDTLNGLTTEENHDHIEHSSCPASGLQLDAGRSSFSRSKSDPVDRRLVHAGQCEIWGDRDERGSAQGDRQAHPVGVGLGFPAKRLGGAYSALLATAARARTSTSRKLRGLRTSGVGQTPLSVHLVSTYFAFHVEKKSAPRLLLWLPFHGCSARLLRLFSQSTH